MALVTFYIKLGDRLPKFRTTLVDSLGNPIDLTTATAVTFRMRKLNSASVTPAISAAANVVTPASGLVEYAWSATDTTTAGVGRFEAEWVITFPGGLQTNPDDSSTIYIVDVVPNLAS